MADKKYYEFVGGEILVSPKGRFLVLYNNGVLSLINYDNTENSFAYSNVSSTDELSRTDPNFSKFTVYKQRYIHRTNGQTEPVWDNTSKVQELTLGEIADKFGIPVDKLRIKE